MPQMLKPGDHAGVVSNPTKKKTGTFLVKVGAMLEHRLERDLELPSGRFLKRGGKIHLSVENFSLLSDEEAKHVKWMCRNPNCLIDDETGAHRRYPTKRALLSDHAPREREFRSSEEIHLVVGVGWMPAVPAVQEERDKKTGELLVAAAPPIPARLCLYSDEE